MMRDDFCVMILTHGRAGNVRTVRTLKGSGYTGKLYFVVDDEDSMLDQYRAEFGSDRVLVFSKREIAERVDPCDNFGKMGAILYARRAAFDLARSVGCKYFIQLDDDYTRFGIRWGSDLQFRHSKIKTTMDECLTAMLEYFISIDALSIAMAQGGDFIGGDPKAIRAGRKAMNSFICSVDREFEFAGTMNDDVSAYVSLGSRGKLFLTIRPIMLTQADSQSSPGGTTELYLDAGTYAKSFYTVMQAPSCVSIGVLTDRSSPHPRIHHDIDWPHAVPLIIREEFADD